MVGMIIDLMKKRRSIRSYRDKPLSESDTRTLLSAALLSPSSRSIRPWQFVLVDDKDTLLYLSRAKHGAKMIAEAALAIVIVGDTSASDVWVEDCSIAASNILLAATDCGLGACWVQIRNRHHSEEVSANDYVARRLSIPDSFAVEAIIAVGHPGEDPPPLTEKDMDWDKVHTGSFVST